MTLSDVARSAGKEVSIQVTTIDEVAPAEVWVTHGREEALIRALALKGIKGRALSLIGYEDEAE